MRFVTYLVLTLLTVAQLMAQVTQEWVNRYNGPGNGADNASSMAVDHSGNVYVTGTSVGSGSGYDYATVKYNTDGAEQWVARYRGPADTADWAHSIAVDGSGNVYVTGTGMGIVTGWDYVTIKYNSSGGEEWVARYNSSGNYADYASAIAVDGSGNVYVTGYSKSGSGGTSSADYTTIKYSSAGAEEWVALYDGPGHGNDWAKSITVDNSGNVYVTGYSDGGITTLFDIATVKYNSAGTQQWAKRYNGPGNGFDCGFAIAVDRSGSVYVAGIITVSVNNTDYTTIKYNSIGTQQWIKTYNGPGNSGDAAYSIALDSASIQSVYVTGYSTGSGTNADYTTIKYYSTGVQAWVSRYNGPANNGDLAYSITVDGSNNVYVTGSSWASGTNEDYATVKYSAAGVQQWVIRYNGPENENDRACSIGLDDSANVYVTGTAGIIGTSSDYATIKYTKGGYVYQPSSYEKWISGETNTIKWSDYGWSSVNIKCILDYQTPLENEFLIERGIPVSTPEYIWKIPDTILSYQSKIIVENAADTTKTLESGVFRLKPYVLTKVNSDSTYRSYKKNEDAWGFQNWVGDVWPITCWTQFNYQGIDPFTHWFYPQDHGDSTFANIPSYIHPDWVSWVNTFSVSACYFDTTNRIYEPSAILKWRSRAENWKGSCFGIAASNALAFGFKQPFMNKYPNFPVFANPSSVFSDDNVVKVVNEIFTYQFGNPRWSNALAKYGVMKPTSTLHELKQMLGEDNSRLKTLSIFNNGPGGGGHNILAYGLTQDSVQKNIYYTEVYDNSKPYSINPIIIDTSLNGGNGYWYYDEMPDWGGNQNIFLENPAEDYLGGTTFPKAGHYKPSVTQATNILEICNSSESSIQISDDLGNVTGYFNDTVFYEIPGSFPEIALNGSKTPPYGYDLSINPYSVVMNNFISDTVETYFFTDEESFTYERTGALQSQTDRLFYGDGLSVSNPDSQTKSIKLLNIKNDFGPREKVFILRSIDLAQNDSVRIVNSSAVRFELISYGSAKNYNVELYLASKTEYVRFIYNNISLSENTTHIFVADWNNLATAMLKVLVDNGNDETIDTTLYLQNQITGVGHDQGSLLIPDSYNLAQNYPNPFNPVTVISYQLPVNSQVTLKVFDVATLVNENKNSGSYEIEFNGSKLPSGMYFYRLYAHPADAKQTRDFVQTKKLLLLR
jgi:hypothetical protein